MSLLGAYDAAISFGAITNLILIKCLFLIDFRQAMKYISLNELYSIIANAKSTT